MPPTSNLSSNPLATRADLQNAVHDLWAPVVARRSPGGARIKLGHTSAVFSTVAAELEGFARPLWGLVPLAAGGGEVDWQPIRQGLISGSDPSHPEFWGWADDCDQRLVEMAALGFALAIVPNDLWAPLPAAAQRNLADWLSRINKVDVVDNNWWFFRVLVNLGLERVGATEYDADAEARALDRLESFYLADGWYEDGPTGRCDYYLPWAMHFYGLIYARLAGHRDPARAQRFTERAAAFAQHYVHWCAADGSAVPYGRSLTYRFAQAAFWGALAYANVEALPWGDIKGLFLRNLRWWAGQAITDNSGVLTIGYGYPNLWVAEEYSSPGSPYWAMKAFIALAVPESHPFWRATETALPDVDRVVAQPQAGMLMCRDTVGGHVFGLAGGQPGAKFRHGPEKYAKLAYSTAFGFSVPAGNRRLSECAPDSMLALSDDEAYWRVRVESDEVQVGQNLVRARWRPWRDVEVETWLLPWLPWHVRVHRVRSKRRLWSAEGGWAVSRDDAEVSDTSWHTSGERHAVARYRSGASGLRDLAAARTGDVLDAGPNTNVIHPRTAIPVLRGEHMPGEHWLICGVLGMSNPANWDEIWANSPTLDTIRGLLPDDMQLPAGWAPDVIARRPSGSAR